MSNVFSPKKIFAHRINTAEQLQAVSPEYGIELDIRPEGDDMILHHDPFCPGERFSEFLDHYHHSGIILNVKAEGMENRLIKLMEEKGIDDYFFLDLSLPFLVKTIRNGCNKVAVRFSEYEPLAFVDRFAGKAEWVWVDCFTANVLTRETYEHLRRSFKICIVSPELQSHPLEWITEFRNNFAGFEIDAVCTKKPELWK